MNKHSAPAVPPPGPALRVPLAELVAGPFGLAGIWWMLALTAMARAAAMTSLWHWGGWQKSRA